MGTNCQGICTRHQATTHRYHQSNYLHGVKRCQVCCIFLKWDGFFVHVAICALEPGHVLSSIKRDGGH